MSSVWPIVSLASGFRKKDVFWTMKKNNGFSFFFSNLISYSASLGMKIFELIWFSLLQTAHFQVFDDTLQNSEGSALQFLQRGTIFCFGGFIHSGFESNGETEKTYGILFWLKNFTDVGKNGKDKRSQFSSGGGEDINNDVIMGCIDWESPVWFIPCLKSNKNLFLLVGHIQNGTIGNVHKWVAFWEAQQCSIYKLTLKTRYDLYIRFLYHSHFRQFASDQQILNFLIMNWISVLSKSYV